MMYTRDPKFDDIRPYYDEELPQAMRRIAQSEFFPVMARYIYPDKAIDDVRALLLSFEEIERFQFEVMRCVNEQIIKRSTTGFSYGGIQSLNPESAYLYVSNHRDIMLDACLLQYVFYHNGFHTSEITFGSNLMSAPLVVDIGKSNKMFRVERGGNMKDFYKSAMHLSEYIRYVITCKQQSVWIAQRNGRTKDGNDATDQGIIKMFGMSRTDDKIESIAQLNIVPIAISYEWEPCDVLKALELYQSRSEKYVKKPGEDLNSILTGITQPKGHVHIQLCDRITRQDLQPYAEQTKNEFNRVVAELIDTRIWKAYHLSANNYIAHDLLYGHSRYKDLYTQAQREDFLHHLDAISSYDVSDVNTLKDIFLGIYAHPVNNKYRK